MSLADFGWDDHVEAAFAAHAGKPDTVPARVLIEFNHNYRVATDQGELEAVLAGRMKHHAQSRADLPAVGDWVAVKPNPAGDRDVIQSILPRRTFFSRKAAGRDTQSK